MFNDSLKVNGDVAIKLYNKDGSLKDERNIKNLVVTVGKNFIASRFTGTTTIMSHMAIGSGAVAPALTNTTLGTELARVALTSSSVNGASVIYVASFPAGVGTGALTEAGVLNASSAGTLLCRTVFAVVNKAVDDAMSITWQVTVF
jgi:hypothetical protein